MIITLIGITPPSSFTEVKAHRHEEYEVLYILEGTGNLITNGQEYAFSPGTIMVVPPLVHSEKSIEGFRDIFIRVKGLIPPSPDGSSTVSTFQDTPEKDIGYLANLAHRVFQKKEGNWEQTVRSLFDSIYQLLLGWSSNKNVIIPVENFKNIIIQNLSNSSFDIGRAMQESGLCKDYLRRLFKKSTGYTPIEYLTNLRVEYALKLIAQRGGSGFSIKEICYLSGFSDPYYFSRVIRSKTGKSPNNWSAK